MYVDEGKCKKDYHVCDCRSCKLKEKQDIEEARLEKEKNRLKKETIGVDSFLDIVYS